MSVPVFTTYAEFWPYYVGEHRDPTCRALHVVGTSIVFGVLGLAIGTMNPWWLLAAPLSGYFFAWVGHFGFEKNRPATFTYPGWSLRGDFQMFFYTLMGRMPAELARAEAARLAREGASAGPAAGW